MIQDVALMQAIARMATIIVMRVATRSTRIICRHKQMDTKMSIALEAPTKMVFATKDTVNVSN